MSDKSCLADEVALSIDALKHTIDLGADVIAIRGRRIKALKVVLNELLAAYEDQLPISEWNMTVTGHVAVALNPEE